MGVLTSLDCCERGSGDPVRHSFLDQEPRRWCPPQSRRPATQSGPQNGGTSPVCVRTAPVQSTCCHQLCLPSQDLSNSGRIFRPRDTKRSVAPTQSSSSATPPFLCVRHNHRAVGFV